MEDIKLLTLLRSNRLMLYVTLICVLSLSATSYFVLYEFSEFSSPWREIICFVWAMTVCFYIMIFTVRKNYQMAKRYSYFEMVFGWFYAISIAVKTGNYWLLIPMLPFFTVMPLSVYNCAKELEVDINNRPDVKKK